MENYKIKYKDSATVDFLNLNEGDYIHPNFVLRSQHVYFSKRIDGNNIKVMAFSLKNKSLHDTGLFTTHDLKRISVSMDENYIYMPSGEYGDMDIAEVRM